MIAKLLLTVLVFGAVTIQVAGKDLKVLMIGNSFSACLFKYFPVVVNSVPGHSLELTSAHIPGCSLEQHSLNLKEGETDAEKKPYYCYVWYSSPKKKTQKNRGTLNELLKNNQYDIITIQQASPKSWDYTTFQPFAEEVIAYVRKYQPKAEIVVQQTWSYRCDHPNLKPNPKACWDFDQTGMYERIRDAYAKLAQTGKFRVIPTGDAVQLFRKYTPVKFRPETGKLEYPALPSYAGEVVGSGSWKKNKKTGKMKLYVDRFHLNPDGQYLQACLWFAALYGEPVSKIRFVPEGMKTELRDLLRKCAQEALDHYVQAK